MVSDRVGDFIVRLTNAGAIGKPSVSLPYSSHLEAIARKLKELGFLEAVYKDGDRTLVVTLSYSEQGRPKIQGVRRISKPGRRLYTGAATANSVKGGMGSLIISTPRGILSDREARKVKAGGETLFEVW